MKTTSLFLFQVESNSIPEIFDFHKKEKNVEKHFEVTCNKMFFGLLSSHKYALNRALTQMTNKENLRRKNIEGNFRKFAFGTRSNSSETSLKVLVNIHCDMMYSIHSQNCSESLPNFGQISKKFPASYKQSWRLTCKEAISKSCI